MLPKTKRKQFDNSNYEYADVNWWTTTRFPWDEEITSYNSMLFGNANFRPNQRAIINATKSKRDVFVCMPTGGGKSLTFQLPAITDDGVTIVVMPLLSLIVDQVTQLINKGINVRDYTGNKTERISKYEMIQDVLSKNGPKMIFLTPEKISKSGKIMDFLTELHQRGLMERIVIDEAHCVTQWGKDFREDYLKLGILKQLFPDVCTLALTATAPEIVRKDVIEKLHMRNTIYFQSSFNRPNLIYQVVDKRNGAVIEDMVKFITTTYPKKTGIIYCCTITDCDAVAAELKRTHKLKAAAYHSKMSESERVSVQNKWMMDEVLIIVATIAFGMGINKPDVRFVIHYSFPKSLTNYYQESGRAGRDGLLSHCIIYYSHTDKTSHNYLIKNNPNNTAVSKGESIWEVNSVIRYCEEKITCRRVMQLSYLGEKFNREKCMKRCDNCMRNSEYVERDYSKEAIRIIDCLEEIQRLNVTMKQLSMVLMGQKSGKKRMNPLITARLEGYLKKVSAEEVKMILKEMLFQKILLERYAGKVHVNAYLSLGKKEILKSLRDGKTKVILKIARKKSSAPLPDARMQIQNQQPLQPVNPSPILNAMNSLQKSKTMYEQQSMSLPPAKSLNAMSQSNSQITTIASKPKLSTPELLGKPSHDVDGLYQLMNSAFNRDLPNEFKTPTSVTKIPSQKNSYQDSSMISAPIKYQSTPSLELKDAKAKKSFSKDYGYCTEFQFEEILDRLKIIRKKIYNEMKEKDPALNQTLVDNLENIFPTPGLHELCKRLPTEKEELTVENIKNVGVKLLNQYGENFLEEIKYFIRMNGIKKEEFCDPNETELEENEPENFDIREHLQEYQQRLSEEALEQLNLCNEEDDPFDDIEDEEIDDESEEDLPEEETDQNDISKNQMEDESDDENDENDMSEEDSDGDDDSNDSLEESKQDSTSITIISSKDMNSLNSSVLTNNYKTEKPTLHQYHNHNFENEGPNLDEYIFKKNEPKQEIVSHSFRISSKPPSELKRPRPFDDGFDFWASSGKTLKKFNPIDKAEEKRFPFSNNL